MTRTSNRLLGALGCLAGYAALAACDAPAPEASASASATDPTASEEAVGVIAPAPEGPEEDIRHVLLQEYPDAGPIRYALAWHDLDGDGAKEALVYLAGPYFCGSGGCNLVVLTPAGPMWRKVGDVSVSRTPVAVLETASNGWKDLTVDVAGGGGPSGTVILKFDGEGYPGNASTQGFAPESAKGTQLLPEAPEFSTVEPEPAPQASSAG